MTKEGMMKPTGPLTKVAQPAINAPVKYQRIRVLSAYSSAKKQEKMVADTKKANVISKITILANAI